MHFGGPTWPEPAQRACARALAGAGIARSPGCRYSAPRTANQHAGRDPPYPPTTLTDRLVHELNNLFAIAAGDYQGGMTVLNHLGHIAQHSLRLLQGAELQPLASCDGKSYHVYRDGSQLSRPLRASMFMTDEDELEDAWDALVSSARPKTGRYDARPAEINSVLYTAVNGFSVCYDLWRAGSRKTPGTLFEILVGSLIQAVTPVMTRRAHIPLLEPGESVSTDIVFLEPGGQGGLAIPAKITTRERIVQPFAHQRILDAVFGEGRFRSILVCVSEMQRQRDTGANAICVPGTIRQFQRYLAPLAGLYYLDPPARYLRDDVTGLIPVRTLGDLLARDLPSRLEPEQV